MRTLGLLGGMSWESSIEYERQINESVRGRLGGSHSADLIVRSFDFDFIEGFMDSGNWSGVAQVLADQALSLERAGAEAIVVCTNTMHKVADRIEAAITVPLLHIADATVAAIAQAEVEKVALLGTRFTMQEPFLRSRFESAGIDVVVPAGDDLEMIHRVIFDELVQGVVSEDSRRLFLDAISRLLETGATGVVAGCTEIELLVSPGDLDVPYFPTAELHALAAADWALGD